MGPKTFLVNALLGFSLTQAAALVPQEQNKTLTLPIQVGNDTIYKEFAIVPIEWDVPLDNLTPRSTNTKGNITVTGTIQDVVAALQRTDPTYQLPSDNDDDVLSPLLEPRRNPLLCPNTLRESPFQTRPPGTYTALYRTCGREMPGKWADKKSMYDGIKYLRTVPGQPKNPPGVASCGRVSCSWDTAIYWCNHKENAELVLDTFKSITEGICQLDCADCEKLDGMDWPGSKIKGITFYEEGWSTSTVWEGC